MTGSLDLVPAHSRPDLLAVSVRTALSHVDGEVAVAEIDPAVADTAAFCDRYGVSPEESANCVVVQARRGGEAWLAACVILASTRADVNGLVRRHLQARKVSFAPMELAVAETGMEYGGITPLGLPPRWPLLVDAAVATRAAAVIGSGLRRSKLVVSGAQLAALPGAEVLAGLGQPT